MNAKTLAPLAGRRVALGRNTGAWTFSPNRRGLAIGVDRALGLRIVDVRALKRVADVHTLNGNVLAAAWLSPRRIVGLDRAGIFVVDPIAKRMVAFRQVEATLVAWARAQSSLVLLLGPPPDGIPVAPVTTGGAGLGAARLLLIGADGRARSVPLDRIRTGATFDTAGPPERWVPGLAVDAAGGRAFVVGSGDLVAEVNLQTLAVAYHELREHTSLLHRALGWLFPAAAAKGPIAGPTRQAAWLGNGLLAITGDDVRVTVRPREIDVASKPLGLKLVDTRDWAVRTLEPRATGFAQADGVLLAYGGSYDAQYRAADGMGLAAYTIDGKKLYHLFGDSPLFWATVAGSNVYAAPDGKIVAVDLASGRVMRSLDAPLPQILN